MTAALQTFAVACMAVAPRRGNPQRRPGGSTVGRLTRRSRTQIAGTRFEWMQRACGPVLRVVATWPDRSGRPCHTTFSVERHGLERALDLAIAARTSCGAPQPDRAALLQRLQAEYLTGGA